MAHKMNFSTMTLFKYYITFVLLLACKTTIWAQAGIDDIIQVQQDVRLITDPRLNTLAAYNTENIKNNPAVAKYGMGVIKSARGYRVMIYAGTDRAKANSTKADFMRRFSNVRVYMTYALPQYRIKVGDFATRESASQLYRQLNSLYSPCMVVPDIVEINTFKKND